MAVEEVEETIPHLCRFLFSSPDIFNSLSPPPQFASLVADPTAH